MDTGRLGIVRRQENSRRKFVFMLNDVMKSHYEVVDDCLSREKFEIGIKYDKSLVPVRRTIVKQRVLQQCLKMKRESRKFTNRNLGAYSGKPLYTFSRDIDKFIADNHPRRRRLRQAEKALKESIERGKILDPTKIPEKIKQYFEKNWKNEVELSKPKQKSSDNQESKDIFKNTRHILPPIRGLMNSFNAIKYNFDSKENQNNDIDLQEKDNSKISTQESNLFSKQTKLSESNVVKSSSKETKGPLSREPTRGLLILPPIQQTKELAKR